MSPTRRSGTGTVFYSVGRRFEHITWLPRSGYGKGRALFSLRIILLSASGVTREASRCGVLPLPAAAVAARDSRYSGPRPAGASLCFKLGFDVGVLSEQHNGLRSLIGYSYYADHGNGSNHVAHISDLLRKPHAYPHSAEVTGIGRRVLLVQRVLHFQGHAITA